MKLSAPLRRLARAAAMLSLAALGWGGVPALAREPGTGLSASAEAIAPAAPDAAPELWEELGVPADDARLTADSPHRGLGVRAPR